MIRRSGERGSGISMLAAQHDDDEESESDWDNFGKFIYEFKPKINSTFIDSVLF